MGVLAWERSYLEAKGSTLGCLFVRMGELIVWGVCLDGGRARNLAKVSEPSQGFDIGVDA